MMMMMPLTRITTLSLLVSLLIENSFQSLAMQGYSARPVRIGEESTEQINNIPVIQMKEGTIYVLAVSKNACVPLEFNITGNTEKKYPVYLENERVRVPKLNIQLNFSLPQLEKFILWGSENFTLGHSNGTSFDISNRISMECPRGGRVLAHNSPRVRMCWLNIGCENGTYIIIGLATGLCLVCIFTACTIVYFIKYKKLRRKRDQFVNRGQVVNTGQVINTGQGVNIGQVVNTAPTTQRLVLNQGRPGHIDEYGYMVVE